MASKGKNLSKEEQFPISNPEKIKIGIVVSQWNKRITDNLYQAAFGTLVKSGVNVKDIYSYNHLWSIIRRTT